MTGNGWRRFESVAPLLIGIAVLAAAMDARVAGSAAMPTPVAPATATPAPLLATAQDGHVLAFERVTIPEPTARLAQIDRPTPPRPPEPDTDPADTGSETATSPPAVPAVVVPELARPRIRALERVVRPNRFDLELGARLVDAVGRGEAAGVRIDWPAYRADRERLRAHLERCAARRVLLSAGDSLWSMAEPPGTPWRPDEAVSGYMRMLAGTEAAVAREHVDRIRQRHDLTGGRAVAVLARGFDARLLGGLAELVGVEALENEPVSGRYRLAEGRLRVEKVRVADRQVPGAVDLGRLDRCR